MSPKEFNENKHSERNAANLCASLGIESNAALEKETRCIAVRVANAPILVNLKSDHQ